MVDMGDDGEIADLGELGHDRSHMAEGGRGVKHEIGVNLVWFSRLKTQLSS
jgi:hypothetical protein